MHITKWKKPIRKGYTLHNSNYMTFGKRQNYGNNIFNFRHHIFHLKHVSFYIFHVSPHHAFFIFQNIWNLFITVSPSLSASYITSAMSRISSNSWHLFQIWIIFSCPFLMSLSLALSVFIHSFFMFLGSTGRWFKNKYMDENVHM